MEEFLTEIRDSNKELIPQLIKSKPDLTTLSINKLGWTSLHLAVALDLDWLIDEIAKAPNFKVYIDKSDNYGWSASHLAVSLGRLEIFYKLYSLGADINFLTPQRYESTGFLALKFNKINILKFILKNNFQHINTLTNYQESPLTICVNNEDDFKCLLQNYNLSLEEQNHLISLVSKKEYDSIDTLLKNKLVKTVSNTAVKSKSFSPIKIAVFQGGGVKGIAFYGALKELLEKKVLDLNNLKIVAGTSAGAITAMLLAIGYNIDEFRKILYEMKFNELLDVELREKFLEIKNKLSQTDGLQLILGEDLYDFLFTNIKGLTTGQLSIKEILLQIIANYLAEKNSYLNTVTLKLGLHENTLSKIKADAKKMVEIFNPFLEALRVKQGIFSGNALRETFVKWLEEKGVEKNLTFLKLHNLATGNKKYKDLYVVAYNASTKSTVIFSHEKTPHAIIVDAVRSSMSIQIVFMPHKYYVDKNGVREIHQDYQGDYFFDGGSLDNYILSIFDKKRYLFEVITDGNDLDDKITNKTAIGFRLLSPELYSYYKEGKHPMPKSHNDEVFSFIKNVIFSVTSFTKQENDYSQNPDEIKRSIHINTEHIDTLDFDINEDNKKKLEEFGRKGAKEFLSKYGSNYSNSLENVGIDLEQTTEEIPNISASSNYRYTLRPA